MNNNNAEEFCDYNYVQDSPSSSCAKSDDQCADEGSYDIDYESDENLIEDYVNEEEEEVVVASDPLSPESTSSYSYSIISHTYDMINDDEEEQALNEQYGLENGNSQQAAVEEIKTNQQQQQIQTLPIVSM